MSNVQVVWVSRYTRNPHPAGHKCKARFYWDEAVLERIFDHSLWRPPHMPSFTHHINFDEVESSAGAIVVVPARWHTADVGWLNENIGRFGYALLILCGDEEGVFPWREISHPNMRVWVQTPHPSVHQGIDRGIGDFWPPRAPVILNEMQPPTSLGAHTGGPTERTLRWFFSGQVNHIRRKMAVHTMQRLAGSSAGSGRLHLTSGFAAGMDYREYLQTMASAMVCPAPSGTFTPDSFRLYEALEAGCVPIVDALAGKDTTDPGYWKFLFGDTPPFPVVEDWRDLPRIVKDVARDWPAASNRIQSWWLGKKRQVAYWMKEDLQSLGAKMDDDHTDHPSNLVSILVPSSPIPSHPSTTILEETIASIRSQPGLVDAEICIMLDGVRPEQEHRRQDYEEYQERVMWLCSRRWHNVWVLRHDTHQHQANMTRAALEHVTTPLIAFVEHDTPLTGDIPWENLCRAVLSGRANLIRLYHETVMQPEHLHLMVDRAKVHDVEGVPLIKTAQYSQRPHLASADFYRWMLATYFAPSSRTMIEDVIHGVLHTTYKDRGRDGWNQWRVWLFAPDGNMQRSTHIDARGGDPKYDDAYIFAYPDGTPFGAPRATAERLRDEADGKF